MFKKIINHLFGFLVAPAIMGEVVDREREHLAAVKAGRFLHEQGPWVYTGQPDDYLLYWSEETEPPPRYSETINRG